MIITVLGSGSNGGVPQWDCCCENCSRARKDNKFNRTRSSVTVSLDEGQQVLFDASPDLKFQLEYSKIVPQAHKAELGRQNRVEAIFLTHGHGDHTVGVAEFSTGKSFSIPIYAPPDLIAFLFGSDESMSFFGDIGRLARNYVRPISLKEDILVEPIPGLKISGFQIEHTMKLSNGSYFPSSTFGYKIETDNSTFMYTPDIGLLSDDVLTKLNGVDLYLLDATFWWDDELERVSGIPKSSYDLGHVPAEDSIKILQGKNIGRIVFTHLNHTNPLLTPGNKMELILNDMGFEVAYDGMRIEL
jgi:pyrroloquinoline quinone biosynthesis protein B